MAEIFGAVAAGIAVCHEMIRLAKTIHKVAKNIKNAPKDIGTLTDETITFTGLYGDFLETCERNTKFHEAAWMKRLKVYADNLIRRLQAILDEGDALRVDVDYRHLLKDSVKAHWNWLIRRNVVTHLRTSLAIASQTITGFLNIICIQKLNEELGLLRSIINNREKRIQIESELGVSLEDKIRYIQNKMGHRRSVHETKTRLLKEAQSRATNSKNRMDPEDATISDAACNFAESLDTCAEKVLPRNSGSRSHTSASSDASSGSRKGFRDVRAPDNSFPNASVAPDPTVPKHFVNQSGPDRYVLPAATTRFTTPSRAETRAQNTHTVLCTYQTHEWLASANPELVNISTQTSSRPTRFEPPIRIEYIGRHKILLSSDCFKFNNHTFSFGTYSDRRKSYKLASRFIDEMVKHHDKMDALSVVLDAPGSQSEWFGIPGWIVRPDESGLQLSETGIPDA